VDNFNDDLSCFDTILDCDRRKDGQIRPSRVNTALMRSIALSKTIQNDGSTRHCKTSVNVFSHLDTISKSFGVRTSLSYTVG